MGQIAPFLGIKALYEAKCLNNILTFFFPKSRCILVENHEKKYFDHFWSFWPDCGSNGTILGIGAN